MVVYSQSLQILFELMLKLYLKVYLKDTPHWLPIKMRVTFKICTCMCKILHGLAPDYLSCAIARNAPTRALRSASDATLLAVTVPRRTVGRCSFAVAGPTMWNSLPKSVRTTETLAAFRKQLKTHLFRLHYLL